MLRVIAVRHGHSQANAEGRAPAPDARLAPLGRRQLTPLANRLRSETVEAIYASPLLRTRLTGRAIAKLHGMRLRLREELADLDFGTMAGRPWEEVRTREPTLYQDWRRGGSSFRFPGGESLADLQVRVVRFLGQVVPKHDGGTVFMVTHDAVVRCMASMALGRSVTLPSDLNIPPASVSEFEVSDGSCRVVSLGDVSHLQGVS